MTLTFVLKRTFKTVPLLPYHPKSHASRALLHKTAIKHLYKGEQLLMNELRTRLSKSSKTLLKSSNPQFREAVTSIQSAFNDNATPKFTIFASLWQSVKSVNDLMLGIAIMRVARFLNLPNRKIVLSEFVKTVAALDNGLVEKQESNDSQWTCTDIIAYACKEKIAFVDEDLLNTFIKHCKSPMDAFSMLVYARDTHNVLLNAEGVNILLLKLIDSHKRKDMECGDLVWAAIKKLAACCEIRDDVLLHFLVDCSEEERKELLKVRSPINKCDATRIYIEYFRNKASIDDLKKAALEEPVNKSLLELILTRTVPKTISNSKQ